MSSAAAPSPDSHRASDLGFIRLLRYGARYIAERCFCGELGGAAGAEERLDFVGGAGQGEQVALADAAAAVGEELALGVVFHAFGHYLEVEAAGERDERTDETGALTVARHAGDKLAIDA